MRITFDIYTYPEDAEVEAKISDDFGTVATVDMLAQKILLFVYDLYGLKELIKEKDASLVVELHSVLDDEANRVSPNAQNIGYARFPIPKEELLEEIKQLWNLLFAKEKLEK